MSTSEIVGSIFFATNELLGVEKRAVCARPHFIYHRGFQVQEHTARDVLAGTSLAEKRGESFVSTQCLVAWHLAIRLRMSGTSGN